MPPDDTEAAFAAGKSVSDPTWKPLDRSILNEGRRQPPKFPIDPFCPFWRNWLTSHAESSSVPVDYIVAGLLAGTASLIGNARRASPWLGWVEPTILWTAVIGNPSSGKSPGLRAVGTLMQRLEIERAEGYPETLRRWETEKEVAQFSRELWRGEVKTAGDQGCPAPDMPEAAVEPVRPTRPRLTASDATPEAMAQLLAGEPKGILLEKDELAGWLGSFNRYSGASARPFWLEAFGGGPYPVDRVKNSADPIIIRHLSVSIVGGVQPDRLATALLAGDDDGLVARFLYLWPDPIPPRRPTGTIDDGPALDALRRLMELRMATDEQGNPQPRIVPLDDDAVMHLCAFRSRMYTEAQAATGLYAGHLGKMPGVCIRLALVLAYLEWAIDGGPEPDDIGVKSVAMAAHLIEDYFLPMAQRAFGDASLPQADRDAAAISRRIVSERLDTINEREIYRKWGIEGLNRNSDRTRKAVQILEDAGWTMPMQEATAHGRSKGDHAVNPEVRGGR